MPPWTVNATESSQYHGVPADNPSYRYDRERGRFRTDSGDFLTDAAKVVGVAPVGATRTFVRLWDSDTERVVPANPAAGWARGDLIRGSQYVFVLTSIGPMYDPTNPQGWRYGSPASWRPGYSGEPGESCRPYGPDRVGRRWRFRVVPLDRSWRQRGEVTGCLHRFSDPKIRV
jgi:hypothetical protein